MATPNGSNSSLEAVARQRDLALVCAWLALVIAIALFCANLRDHSSDDLELRQAIEAHQQLLAEIAPVRSDNDLALRRTEATLAEMKKVQHASGH